MTSKLYQTEVCIFFLGQHGPGMAQSSQGGIRQHDHLEVHVLSREIPVHILQTNQTLHFSRDFSKVICMF